MKKRVLVITMAVTMVFGLTACGGSKDKGATTAAATTAAATTEKATEKPAETTAAAKPEEQSGVAGQSSLNYVEIPVTIINGTGVDINALYLSGTSLNEWGENQLEGTTMPHGTYLDLTLNVDADNLKWDLRVEDTDGNPLEWYEVDISEMPSDGFGIELLWDGSQGTVNMISDASQMEGNYTEAK